MIVLTNDEAFSFEINVYIFERRRAHFGHFWAPRDVRYHIVDVVEEV